MQRIILLMKLLYHETWFKILSLRTRWHLRQLGLDPSKSTDKELFIKINNVENLIREYIDFYPEVKRSTVLSFLEYSHIEWRSSIFDLPILNRRSFFRRVYVPRKQLK